MNSINRTAVAPTLLGTWFRSVFFASVVFVACGGKSSQDANSTTPGMAGTSALDSGASHSNGGATNMGGTSSVKWNVATWATDGGTFPSGGVSAGGAFSSGGTGLAGTEIADVSTSDGGQSCSCDNIALENALTFAATSGACSCFIASDSFYADTLGQPWGTFSIDSEGRVSVATGPGQEMVDTLGTQGWCCPFEAGRTYTYWCECPL
jgi:hypothetical protein